MTALVDLRERERRWLMQTYRRAPVEFVRGEGARLWDSEGKEYLDFLAGISVCSVGHCHPDVVAAVRAQAGELMHVSNLFYTAPMVRLAERLSTSSLGGKVFFANSGTEANECAIKVARKNAYRRGVENPEIVSFERDFHGRTYGALSATPNLAENPALQPMLPGFRSVPFDDAGTLRDAVYEETAAVLIEPIQGESGVYPLSEETLLAAREACDETGALLIFDEIQTGMGRTGSVWAYEQTPVRPDLLTTAKALGGGLPIGAMLARAEISFAPGDHASTFGGGPVVCAGALAVLDTIERDGLLLRSRLIGEALPGAAVAAAPSGAVVDARGRGCLWGFQLTRPVANDVVLAMIDEGVLATAAGPDVVRMSPPLTSSDDEVAEAARAFGAAVATVLAPAEEGSA